MCKECIWACGMCIALHRNCITFLSVLGKTKILGWKPWDWTDAIWIGNVNSLWWLQVQDKNVYYLRTCSCAWRAIFNFEHRMSCQIGSCSKENNEENCYPQVHLFVGSWSCRRVQCSMEHTVEAIQQWLQRPFKTASKIATWWFNIYVARCTMTTDLLKINDAW